MGDYCSIIGIISSQPYELYAKDRRKVEFFNTKYLRRALEVDVIVRISNREIYKKDLGKWRIYLNEWLEHMTKTDERGLIKKYIQI